MSLDAALKVFDQNRSSYLQDLFALLRFQSISAQSQHAGDIAGCAEWLRQQLASAGLQAEVVPTGGHPAVLADTGPVAGAGTTLLFYGHYDVQPVGDPGLWNSPPFEPQIREEAIYARGSADDKGQVMTHLAAMRSWRQTGADWPVRIKFLIEGEEEIGSPNLPALVEKHRERLACDYVVLSDTSKLDHDTPAVTYATRGLVYKEVTIDGPAKDLHSGQYGGAVANPVNVLAAIIASFRDEKHRVTIAGFYDDVLTLSPEERRSIAEHSRDSELLAASGSPALSGEEGFTATEHVGARPTLDVNGIVGGYTGQGSSTIIPARARAKISMRLVPSQDPGKISRAFDAAVRKACPSSVRLRIEDFSHAPAYVAPTGSPGMRAAIAALKESYGREPVMIREGGTLPILALLKKVLGADSLMLGFAYPDCNVHSPNEFFHVSDFERGTRCILRLLATADQRQM